MSGGGSVGGTAADVAVAVRATETVVGTRGSRLARAQATAIVDALRRRNPALDLRLLIVSTEGDRVQSGPLPSWGRGVFVKDIEVALLAGEIDLAVHSLKDIPPQSPEGLALLAIPSRADPSDVLITADGRRLDELSRGARVGTSSLRRAAFLRAYRPDLEVVPVRGNVDTRLRKLLEAGRSEERFDALVLAAAGLERLGLTDVPRAPIPFEVLLPAPGQGALAIEGRAGDERHRAIAAAVQDAPSAAAVTAERRLVRDLDSGCRLPLAALATPGPGGTLRLEGAVAAPDGRRLVRLGVDGRLDDPEGLGQEVAGRLLQEGAADILAAAERAAS